MSTFDKQLQEHAEKYKSMFKSPEKKKKKFEKPMTESSMKGFLDLGRVINDAMYCRIQDSVPNSDCFGLTKE